MLTVYGIETSKTSLISSTSLKVATVLTVYGIETLPTPCCQNNGDGHVATVLTVYGIETLKKEILDKELLI